MSFTVPVVGIFTNGAVSSATRAQRTARFNDDIARANQAWGSGFFPGVACGLNFVFLRRFYQSNLTIDASTVDRFDDPQISNLVNAARRATNNATAIYVVYVSGNNFADGADGEGGALFKNFRSTTDYELYGQVALAGGALNSYIFAHEAGHGLFGRFVTFNDTISFTTDDPSNPGDIHSDNPQNLMNSFVPARNPIINSDQCSVARQSKLVMVNVARARRNRNRLKSNPQMVKRLNKVIAAKMKSAKPDVVRRKRAAWRR
ncbi:hypothetical protein [Paenibacillus mendelii]|uniref:Uncharacterized protein n=1 Tax=Paenibacillus mendelii TaxID=206163 RepID=A0ABV6J317_9BACL|nr:hypothetical protein [Paenibacillus mendelii]MCQ6559379.1 hypothetical protein [Paenibacillus mendelii]